MRESQISATSSWEVGAEPREALLHPRPWFTIGQPSSAYPLVLSGALPVGPRFQHGAGPSAPRQFFYETFAAEMAHELKNKFQYHYTPKKASWLNMVEIELSIIAKQCLDRRIPSMTELAQEVKSLVQKRNCLQATIQWRFTTAKARTKVSNRYAVV